MWKYDGTNPPSLVDDIRATGSNTPLDLPSSTMNFITKPLMEIMEMNYGSMTELIIQVWLLISTLEVAVVTPIL